MDEEAARALGFGTVLDHVERSVERPFEWTPTETRGDAPADGYMSATRVSFTSSIVSVEHLVPSLEGCEDRIAVHLLVSFQSEDGALSIQGPMLVVASRDERAPYGNAVLDLATAEGSLRLYPDSSSLIVVGRVFLSVRFWPEDVRGHVRPYVVDDASIESDTAHFYYEPLSGRWPVDACSTHAWPLAADTPGATPDGDSALAMRDQLQSLLNQGPATGGWWDGAETVVTTELGPPTEICVEEVDSQIRQLSYSVPITFSTDDGRLHVAQSGTGVTSFDEAASIRSAWVSLYEADPVSEQDFAQATGVAMSFGAPAAIWHVDVEIVRSDAAGIHGTLAVEPVDANGILMEPISVLDWSN